MHQASVGRNDLHSEDRSGVPQKPLENLGSGRFGSGPWFPQDEMGQIGIRQELDVVLDLVERLLHLALGSLDFPIEGLTGAASEPDDGGSGREARNQSEGDQGQQYERDPELGPDREAGKQLIEIDHPAFLPSGGN